MSFAERQTAAVLSNATVQARCVPYVNRRTCVAALMAADVALLFAAEVISGLSSKPVNATQQLALLALPLIVVFSLVQQNCYSLTDRLSPRSVLVALVNAAGLLALGVCALWAFNDFPVIDGASGSAELLVFAGAAAFLTLGRSTVWAWIRPHVLTHMPDGPAIIVGADSAPPELIRRLKKQFALGTIISAGVNEAGWRDAVAMAHRGAVSSICVIVTNANAPTLGCTLASLSSLPVPVKLVFDTGYGTVLSREMSARSGLAAFHITEPPLTDSGRIIKRIEDIVLGGLLLLICLPAMILAAIAIRLDSPGPIFFRQQRHGHNNRVIQVLKFRTMYHHLEDRDASRQTSRGDPRVTRVGAFLRRHSLDEMPQLLNVVGGSMSLVGPRPHALGTTVNGHGLEAVVSNYYARHKIKPGITGWAQVSGWRGNLDSIEKAIQRVEHDLYYIENWSLLFDLWIMIRTFGIVIWDRGAY